MAHRPATVRNIRLRTIGSGTRLVDEFPLPLPVYHGGRFVRWLWQHWRTTTVVFAVWAVWALAGSLLVAVVVVAAAVAGLTLWVSSKRRSAEGGSFSLRDTVESQRQRSALTRQWPLACQAAGLTGPGGGPHPGLHRVHVTGDGTIRASVSSGRIGVPVPAVAKAAGTLAEVVGCREVVVTATGPGVADLAFHWRDPVGRNLPLADLPVAPSGHLAYGVRQDGSPATVRATQSILIGGLTRMGKALALDTPVPTPSGWTTMGEIRPGDVVFSETGEPCTVTDAWDVLHGRPCYRVVFSDGSAVVADADHQWLVETAASRQSAATAARPKRGGPFSHDQSSHRQMPRVLTTAEIAASARRENLNQRANYSIPVAGALQSPAADLPVPPYTLGAWLGDGTRGSANFTTADPETLLEMAAEGVEARKLDCGGPYLYGLLFPDPTETVATCRHCDSTAVTGYAVCGAHMTSRVPCTRCGVPCRAVLCRSCRATHGPSMVAALRRSGVLEDKHIPVEYMRGSEGQRRALLAGLLDTDGYCSKLGTVDFYNTNERLARDVFHLVASLGYKPTIRSKTARLDGRDCGLVWTVGFTPADKVFRLPRKVARQVTSTRVNTTRRYITSVEPVESVPVRCIAVDSPSHLFLVGEACIATHNSNLVWTLLADAIRQGVRVDLYVSDPKGGVELDALEQAVDAHGSLLRVRQYAKTPAETVKMLEAVEKAMHARQHWMKSNGVRKVAPDAENPLVVTILDETLPLTELLKKGTDSSLGRVAFTGAAAGYVVWANTQVAQVDSIGRFRDLIPQRICFATPNPQVTDSVLGQGSESSGARCSEINLPGVGFSHSEGDRVARKFRAAFVSDATTKLIAAGRLPQAVMDTVEMARGEADGKTALYRWYSAADASYFRPLYIGISYDVLKREAEHNAALREFMSGDVRRTVEWYPSRKAALAAEKRAIAAEKPTFNVQHNGGNRLRRRDARRSRVVTE